MIPLKMQKDYSPQGWLGMLLGTRMWYAMWGADQEDDAAFERRLDSVVREIGDRGMRMVSEVVPLPRAHSAVPAPAPALVRAPTPALGMHPKLTVPPAPAPTTVVGTPDRILGPPPCQRSSAGPSSVTSGGFTELTMFMEKQQRMQIEWEDRLEAKLVAQQQAMEAQRQAMNKQQEARLKEAKAEKAELEAKLEKALRSKDAITDEQLSALQARFETLHSAKLLEDEELYAFEVGV